MYCYFFQEPGDKTNQEKEERFHEIHIFLFTEKEFFCKLSMVHKSTSFLRKVPRQQQGWTLRNNKNLGLSQALEPERWPKYFFLTTSYSCIHKEGTSKKG